MARIEVMSGVERRRRWSREAKLRILAEADQPGVRIGEWRAAMIFIRPRSGFGGRRLATSARPRSFRCSLSRKLALNRHL
jgi:hypothetical protein